MLRKGSDGFGRSAQSQLRGNKAGDGKESFDRWLDRELRCLRVALSEPVQPNLVDLIQGHKKITR
jgi:hypothetical protein